MAESCGGRTVATALRGGSFGGWRGRTESAARVRTFAVASRGSFSGLPHPSIHARPISFTVPQRIRMRDKLNGLRLDTQRCSERISEEAEQLATVPVANVQVQPFVGGLEINQRP